MNGIGEAPVVRAATPADIPAISAIYAHHVATGTASFEVEPPHPSEMLRRFREITDRGLPYLIATLPAASQPIAGYAYASVYRTRIAYRYTLEDSVYVDQAFARRGIGRLLLDTVIRACEPLGYRQMLAVIGGSDNAASIGVHAALGFERVGTFNAVGRKFDRWVDTVLMQRALGSGSATPPSN